MLKYVCLQIAALPNIRHAVVDISDPRIEIAEVLRISKDANFDDRCFATKELSQHAPEQSLQQTFARVGDGKVANQAEGKLESSDASGPGHIKDWSGDTLVASDAKDFLGHHTVQNSTGCKRHYELHDIPSMVPRRLFPTLRSGVSPNHHPRNADGVAQDPFETPPFELRLKHALQQDPVRSEQSPTGSGDIEECRRSSSSGTVKIHSPSGTPQPPDFASRRVSNGATLTPTSRQDALPPTSAERSPYGARDVNTLSPLASVKPVKIAKKPVWKRPWQSPCQEDFSPQSKYRLGKRKLAAPSLKKKRTSIASEPRPTTWSRRSRLTSLRSTSADHLFVKRRCLSPTTPVKHPRSKRVAYTIGCAKGRKIKFALDGAAGSSDRSYSSTSCSSSSDDHNSHVRADEFFNDRAGPEDSQNVYHHQISSHKTSKPVIRGAGDALNRWSPSPATQNPSLFITTGSCDDTNEDNQSVNIECRKYTKHNVSSRFSSPDTSDCPWIRRDFTSSRWFPPLLESANKDPSWHQSDGKLFICFPGNCEPAAYEIDAYAAIHLSGPDSEGWYAFSVPGLPSLHKSQTSGRLSFFQQNGAAIDIDKSALDYAEDCGPFLTLGGSHFGSSTLLRLKFEHLHYAKARRQPYAFSNVEYGLVGENCVKRSSTDCPLVTMDLHHPKLRPYFQILSHTSSRRCSIDHNLERRTGLKDGNLGKIHTENGLCPVHFAGLHSQDDPLELEASSNIVWNLEMHIDRIITGELEYRMSLEAPSENLNQLIIDARDWIPYFSLIDGELAHQSEWVETDIGNMALHLRPTDREGDLIRVEIYWKGFICTDGSKYPGSTRAEPCRLPNIVDKVVLNGSLTCNVDNALIILDDCTGDTISWRADSMIGSSTIGLPKLYPGYSIHMKMEDWSGSVDAEATGRTELEDTDVLVVPHLKENTSKQSAESEALIPAPEAPCRRRIASISSTKDNISTLDLPTTPNSSAQESLQRDSGTANTALLFRSTYGLLKYVLIVVLCLHIFELINTASTPDTMPQGEQDVIQKNDMPSKHRSSNIGSILFAQNGVKSWNAGISSTTDDKAEQVEMIEDEAEGYVGSETQTSPTEAQSWRDIIDRALGWGDDGSEDQ